MQWVSTFTFGASSPGRSRRLEDYPAESDPPSSGKIWRELPSLTRGIQEGKTEKKSLCVTILTWFCGLLKRHPLLRVPFKMPTRIVFLVDHLHFNRSIFFRIE